MHFDAEAVPGAVPERLGQAVAAQRVARRGVDLQARSPGTHGRDGAVVRFEDRAVDLPGPSVAGPIDTVRVKSTQYEA